MRSGEILKLGVKRYVNASGVELSPGTKWLSVGYPRRTVSKGPVQVADLFTMSN
jgi:hypothetical protein